MAACSGRKIDVILDDRTPHKWIEPLTEDGYQSFIMSKGINQQVITRKVFGDGSLFSPLLFGKFFDPSDAFPLWDFEADVLLSNLRASGYNQVDWDHKDSEYYFLRAELPGVGEESVQVCIERGKTLEISGEWKKQQQTDNNTKTRDWKSRNWWEYGFVRRIELPDNVDWKKADVTVKNDTTLEIRIPILKSYGSPSHQGHVSD